MDNKHWLTTDRLRSSRREWYRISIEQYCNDEIEQEIKQRRADLERIERIQKPKKILKD